MLSTGKPGRALELTNRSMVERGQHDIFTTAVVMVFDVVEGTVQLANAGHLPPLLRRKDRKVEPVLEGAGTAIGFFEGEEFPQTSLTLEPGEALLLCTDGVIEAVAPDGVAFGNDRLTRSFGAGPRTATDVAHHVLTDLSLHVREAPQYDDITMIVLGRAQPG
jgi:sigma-B regulation protein RsbU (phosphoserine phosphatase)